MQGAESAVSHFQWKRFVQTSKAATWKECAICTSWSSFKCGVIDILQISILMGEYLITSLFSCILDWCLLRIKDMYQNLFWKWIRQFLESATFDCLYWGANPNGNGKGGRTCWNMRKSWYIRELFTTTEEWGGLVGNNQPCKLLECPFVAACFGHATEFLQRAFMAVAYTLSLKVEIKWLKIGVWNKQLQGSCEYLIPDSEVR